MPSLAGKTGINLEKLLFAVSRIRKTAMTSGSYAGFLNSNFRT
jgi:hypothetical protein